MCNRILSVPVQVLFGGKELNSGKHTIPKQYGAIEPTAGEGEKGGVHQEEYDLPAGLADSHDQALYILAQRQHTIPIPLIRIAALQSTSSSSTPSIPIPTPTLQCSCP